MKKLIIFLVAEFLFVGIVDTAVYLRSGLGWAIIEAVVITAVTWDVVYEKEPKKDYDPFS